MPPKKAAAAASAGTTKSHKVNGVKAPTKAKVHAKTSATAEKSTITKTASKPAAVQKAPKPAAAPSSKKRRAEETDEEEPQINGTVVKRAKKQATASPKAAVRKTAGTTKRAPSVDAKDTAAPLVKKAKAEPQPKTKAKTAKAKTVLNTRPTQILDLYLFGGGESGELGFAGVKGSKEIKRPRLNPYLTAEKAGVVQFAVGGMHTAALTHDNKILTWGVNDQGALGRDTTWDGGLKDMNDADSDSDSESDSDEGEINPHESTPGEVDFSGLDPVPDFTQVTASDSATFALTDDGLVYGWGTFRSNEGIFGFSEHTLIQTSPSLVSGLKNIVKLASGSNHILAIDKAGAVYAWGAGQQNQLGRRILERHLITSLTPAKIGLKGKYTDVGAGSFHSFAVKSNGDVFSWGLNSFGQTGQQVSTAEGGPDVHLPAKVSSLAPDSGNGKVIHVTGGSSHSIAVTDAGAALAWGRLDGYQLGIPVSSLNDDHLIRDANNRPRILTEPTKIPGIDAVIAEAGSDHTVVASRDGKAYGFGFNSFGQCGVGTTDDVETAELIENTAVRGKKIVAVGCGGQFSCVATIHEEAKVNGVHSE